MNRAKVVEKVLGKKMDFDEGSVKYLVKWLGLPEDENSWITLDSGPETDPLLAEQLKAALKVWEEKNAELEKKQEKLFEMAKAGAGVATAAPPPAISYYDDADDEDEYDFNFDFVVRPDNPAEKIYTYRSALDGATSPLEEEDCYLIGTKDGVMMEILHSEILRTRNPAKRAGIINLIAEAKAAINADLQKNNTEEQVASNE